MSRALREYQVLGIRTTIPFFLWLMRQPEYMRAEYDTTYLDRLLAERADGSTDGSRQSFNDLSARDEEVVAIAAALDAYMRASGAHGAASPANGSGAWTRAGRREALRS
jgi:acetyl-CoA carboxylase, biotin carboxylase subunit